jgi:hypothetical protein
VGFTCTAPGSGGTFTIPTSVLGYLLPADINAADQANGTALLDVEAGNIPSFAVSRVGGGTVAIAGFTAQLGYTKNLVVQ